ncbi:MAG: FecR domain-containing protein [Desulfobacterales bacterium]|nr:FecR domain-containing protein [Desulfobacterales bacterium]
MKNRLFIFVLAITVIFPSLTFADGNNTLEVRNDVRIGDVTAFTGNVLVRTNGKWSKLEKIPFPIFTSDKVVTRQGRAEVEFIGGGILRLDAESNVSINQSEVRSGVLLSKGAGCTRQVNVLVGKVWFKVKVRKKNTKINFITPTMVAAIRGSELTLKVKKDGTDYNYEGDVEISGGNHDPNLMPVTEEQINEAPDQIQVPDYADSDLQKSADQAAKRRSAARRSLADAKRRVQSARNNEELEPMLLAVASMAEAASGGATADVVSAEEVLAEGKIFGDKNIIARAEDFLEGTLEMADSTSDSAIIASEAISVVATAKTDPDLSDEIRNYAIEAYSATALAFASAAEANSNATSAAVNVAEIAVSDIDEKGVTSAQGEVDKAKARASLATEQAMEAKLLADSVRSARTEAAVRAASAASQANTAAAWANAVASRTNARIAEVLSTKDPSLVLATQEAADRVEISADRASKLAEDAVEQAKKAITAIADSDAEALAEATRATRYATEAYSFVTDLYADSVDAIVSGETGVAEEKRAANAEASSKDAADAASIAIEAASRGDAEEAREAAEEAALHAAAVGGNIEAIAEKFKLKKEPHIEDTDPASPF